MIAEIISIGSELLQGVVQDTNATYISRHLLENGIPVRFRTTTGDDRQSIRDAIETALSRAGLVVATGGLGPTPDDITIETAAGLLGLELRRDENTVRKVEQLYKLIGVSFTEASLRQAMVPAGASLIDNPKGTAPGVRLEVRGSLLVFLPGVPREMKAMLADAVSPAVELAGDTVYISRSLRVFGIGESNLEAALPKNITTAENPSFSFLPHRFEVELRLTARGGTPGECSKLLDETCGEIYSRVGEYIYGEGDDDLPTALYRILKEKKLTVGFAESLTGGMAGSHMARVPGASDVFRGAVVAYSRDVKERVLGVPAGILDQHGTVCEETARAMAEQALEVLGCDCAAATTGNAGPAAEGTAEVGQVYIAASFRDPSMETACVSRMIKRPRNDVRLISTLAAFDLLRRSLLQDGGQ